MTDATELMSEQQALTWAQNMNPWELREELVQILNRCPTWDLKKLVCSALVDRAQDEHECGLRVMLMDVMNDPTTLYRIGRT